MPTEASAPPRSGAASGIATVPRAALWELALLAAAVAALHIATNGRYGFHRDELQVLDDARHMGWGFVAYPPFTPALERLAWALFGTSLIGLRLFSVLAQALVLLLAGLLAREFGGGRFAQLTAALAVAVSPLPMFEATEFQYTSFEFLFWVAAAFGLARLLRTRNPRWWIFIGGAIGAGLMTKYSLAFCVAGIAGGLLLTPERRWLANRWLWIGAGLALLVFLPNLIWEARHDWVTLSFLRHIHARDVGEGRAAGFWSGQALLDAAPLGLPLWLAGLIYFFTPSGRRFRLLGWLVVIPVVILGLAHGRQYYSAAVYPIAFAAGAMVWERWLRRRGAGLPAALQALTVLVLLASGALTARVVLPLQPLGAPHNTALEQNGELREEVGWPELAAEVARIRNALPPPQRAATAILDFNYGETGAIDLYGPALGLPPAISRTNTAWYRGYGNPAPPQEIVLGVDAHWLASHFSACRVAGHDGNSWHLDNEESREHPDIFLCGPPRAGWPAFWAEGIDFG